jgi:hypothetical protein
MLTLSLHQIGIAKEQELVKDTAPFSGVLCPYCDREMNPTGNVVTHVIEHPDGIHRVFYRTHKSCALDSLPHEEERLTQRAVELADAELERIRLAPKTDNGELDSMSMMFSSTKH